MARTVHQLAKELEMHSDTVRAALNAIPTDIALGLPDQALDDLIRAIHAFGKEVFDQGMTEGRRLEKKPKQHPTGAGL